MKLAEVKSAKLLYTLAIIAGICKIRYVLF